MNWIGGARSRAKAQEQFNRSRGNFPPTRPRTQNQPTDGHGDRDEGEDSAEADVGNRSGSPPQAPIIRQSRRKRNEENDWFKKDVDFEALGYKLVEKDTVQRRVVPLLEFAEKTFPKFGHMLSLQLSYQMDIARTPAPRPTPAMAESLEAVGGGEGEALHTPSSFRVAPSQNQDQDSAESESSLTSANSVLIASATPVSDSGNDDHDDQRSKYFLDPELPPLLPPLELDYVTTVTSGLGEDEVNEDESNSTNSEKMRVESDEDL